MSNLNPSYYTINCTAKFEEEFAVVEANRKGYALIKARWISKKVRKLTFVKRENLNCEEIYLKGGA